MTRLAENQPRNPTARRISSVIGGILSLAALYYFVNRLVAQADSVMMATQPSSLVLAILAGLAAYTVAFLPLTGAWHQAVYGFSGHGDFRTSSHVLLISQFAKYIPGNVGQYVGRFALGRAVGYPSAAIMAATVFETVSAIWVALVIGSLSALDFLREVLARIHVGEHRLMGAGAALLASTLLLPLVLVGANRLKPRVRALENLEIPTWRTAIICACLYGVSFVLLAVVVMVVAGAGFDAHTREPLTVIGVVTWAWLAGFVTPGAPAGVGVREVVLLVGLGSVYGESTATGVALLFRVVTTVGDGVGLCAGLLLRRFGRLAE